MGVFNSVAILWSILTTAIALPNDTPYLVPRQSYQNVTTPKVVIISMFSSEGDVWNTIPEFDLSARNITVPGFSPLFPTVRCTAIGDICQLVTGEGEINAASTITALTLSSLFDLKRTYFLIAGIAGVSPKVATIGSVTFARYAVSVGLQYEIDAREIPSNFTTGFVPQVNEPLRRIAMSFAETATLNDSTAAMAYRANYASNSAYEVGSRSPSVVACDTATTDVFYSGTLLSEAFENTTALFTNGSGVYCSSEQEDTATLEALLRAAANNFVDFSRIIVMRTGSDFDRPYPGQAVTSNLFYAKQGYPISVQNVYLAGVKVVQGIVGGWNSTFERGVNATNYVGDIFGTLGGQPDFGPGKSTT